MQSCRATLLLLVFLPFLVAWFIHGKVAVMFARLFNARLGGMDSDSRWGSIFKGGKIKEFLKREAQILGTHSQLVGKDEKTHAL